MTRFAIFLFWLLHFLPLPLLAPLGKGSAWCCSCWDGRGGG